MRPVSSPCTHMRRVVSRASAVSYWASTSHRSRTAGPSAEAGRPTREPTVAASSAGSRSRCSQPSTRVWSSAHSSSRRTGHPGPEPGIAPSSRTRAASPGAWASTMRAAVSSHSAYPACSAPARPDRSRSARRRSSSPAPTSIRAARRSARLRAASASTAAAVSLRSARCRRPSSHCRTQSGGSCPPGTAAGSPDHRSSSPSACLQGNLRLGQLHLKAGADGSPMSTIVRYGVLPLPLHSPHTAPSSSLPAPDHGPDAASLLPALRDAASGASASTCSALQRTPC